MNDAKYPHYFSYRPLFMALALAALIISFAPGAKAEETRDFMGETITISEGRYLVTADVNVRAKPTATSEKVGRFDEGVTVKILGRFDKDWLAVEDGGKDLGFVYGPPLVPLIDATLEEPLRGMTMGPDQTPCEYIVRFEGREEIQAREPMQVANFEVGWRCRASRFGDKVVIVGYMFITESPYDGGTKPRYQLSVDLPGYADEPDKVFSTIMIFDADKKELIYDGLTQADMGHQPKQKTRPAETAERALVRAMEMAPETWGKKFWEALIKQK